MHTKNNRLAREDTIHVNIFYYYNFDGRRLLEKPIEQLLADPSLDIPFCLMWRNESWTRRRDGRDDEILIRQAYEPAQEQALLADLGRHFADPRYIRVDGRPLFIIHRPASIPEARDRLARWRRRLAEELGHTPWLLMAQSTDDSDPRAFGLDGAVESPPHRLADVPLMNSRLTWLDSSFSGKVRAYDDVIEHSLSAEMPPYRLIKTICPSWDDDCRRQGAGLTLHGATPHKYERWLGRLIERARRQPFNGEALLFVHAWNEWAEAAYLEPDVFYGAAYLNATARALVATPG
jgi:lipopolysaccharide biosynthesis protein